MNITWEHKLRSLHIPCSRMEAVSCSCIDLQNKESHELRKLRGTLERWLQRNEGRFSIGLTCCLLTFLALRLVKLDSKGFYLLVTGC